MIVGKTRTRLAGLLVAVLASCAAATTAGRSYDVVATRVMDGDTIEVEFPSGLKVEVRLLSIDAPEKDQSLGDQAKRFVKQRVVGHRIRLETLEQERDRYNRLLAFVHLDEQLVNEAIVEAGLAVVWVIPPNVDKVDALLDAQRSAFKAERGVWGVDGPEYEPRVFRKLNKSKSRQLSYDNHTVIGNTRSKVAHWPGCLHPEEMSPKNIVYFDSVSRARKAGYRMEKGNR
jgi:micrococcal nuclease